MHSQELPVMLWHPALYSLFAQDAGNWDNPGRTALMILLVIGVIVGPFFIGKIIAGALKMPDYWWRIGLILFALSASTSVLLLSDGPKFGIDLKGGVILIYDVVDIDPDKTNDFGVVDRGGLITVLQQRINPSGVEEIVIRPYGNRQLEVIVPDVGEEGVKRIKEQISTAGDLKFYILAEPSKHGDMIEVALSEENKHANEVGIEDESLDYGGRWVDVGRVAGDDKKRLSKPIKTPGGDVDEIAPFKLTNPYSYIIRDASTHEVLRPPAGQFADNKQNQFEQWLLENGHAEIELLVAVDKIYRVSGNMLASVRSSFDPKTQGNAVEFNMDSIGAIEMGGLTRDNMPDENGRGYELGIVLDNTLLSAPTIRGVIRGNGQITGQFTSEEIDFLVGILRAGPLGATLSKAPVSESTIDPLLGQVTIVKGAWAIGASLVCVLIFMLVYYRFSGVVACCVLLMNLLLVVALMMLISAAFTLPGIAGLVLTVGMAVDANVLIFERIREELNRGSALRLALRNGFARATTTIVDANVTTLITAIVLYAIGTDQIRGFAVTLILGILLSMFTAIFCARVVFEIAERKRMITKLSMMSMLSTTSIDFMSKQKIASMISVLVIAVSLGAVAGRLYQNNIFDIDFAGGTSVEMTAKSESTTDTVRKLVEDAVNDPAARERVNEAMKAMIASDEKLKELSAEEQEAFLLGDSPPTLTVNNMDYGAPAEGQEDLRGRVYKVTASIPNVETLEALIEEAFRSQQDNSLVAYSMTYTATPTTSRDTSAAKAPTATSPAVTPPATPPTTDQGRNIAPSIGPAENAAEKMYFVSYDDEGTIVVAQADGEAPADSDEEEPADKEPTEEPADPPATDEPADDDSADDNSADEPPGPSSPATEEPAATEPPPTEPPTTEPPTPAPPTTDPPTTRH